MKNAEWLIGTWESKGTFPKDDRFAGQDYVFRVDQQWILEKNAIEAKLTLIVDKQTLKARVLMGWDPSAKKVISCGFSSIGNHGKGVVQIDKNRMHLRDSGFLADGTPSTYKVELILQDKNTLLRKVTERKNGDEKLPNLETVESLTIVRNPKLKHVDGLASLNEIGDFLSILENDSLTNLEGLSSLKRVGDRLEIDRVLYRLVEISDRWIWEREAS